MEASTTMEETLPNLQPTGNITASSSMMLQYDFDRQYSYVEVREDDALISARSEYFAPQKTMIKAVGRDRKPGLLFKGTNYSQSTKPNGGLQSKERNFIIVGNKIKLQLRDKKEHTHSSAERYRNCEGVSRGNEDGENCSETWSQEAVTSHKCRIQVEDGCDTPVVDAQDSFLEGKSYDITNKEEATNKQRKSLLEKRGPQITVSLPSSTKGKDGETPEGFDQRGIFNQRTYLVCAQSPSCDTRWRTTSVNFPDEAWKLERRRLSHRHSSLGSSISLSFARLDLVCKTPEHSPVSTPICDKNFVFPNMNGF